MIPITTQNAALVPSPGNRTFIPKIPVTSVSGSMIVATASGSLDFDTNELVEPDVMYVIDLASGEQTKLLTSAGAYSIGTPAYDMASGILLVPDSGDGADPLNGVWRFVTDDSGELEEDVFVEVAPDSGLASRHAHVL